MGLLALGMCYVLLLANGNADFGAPAPKPPQAPWPQPRQSVPGWLSLHLSFLERISDSGSSQVWCYSKQISATDLGFYIRVRSLLPAADCARLAQLCLSFLKCPAMQAAVQSLSRAWYMHS